MQMEKHLGRYMMMMALPQTLQRYIYKQAHNLVLQEFENNVYSNKVQFSGYKSDVTVRYILLYGAPIYKNATIVKIVNPITVSIEANMVDLKSFGIPLLSDFTIQFA